MTPIRFEHAILQGLPVPNQDALDRVFLVLKTVLSRRIMPFFRKTRGTDAIPIARVMDSLEFQRLEDEGSRIDIVEFVTMRGTGPTLLIHERIVDYLAFVIPSSPDSRLGPITPEERKVLAFAELFLRHEAEHLLYPTHAEQDVMRGDVDFAMNRRSTDPTFYRDLREALADEMTGLQGDAYLHLFDLAEQERDLSESLEELALEQVRMLEGLPEPVLALFLPWTEYGLQSAVLDSCYRKCTDHTAPLGQRLDSLGKLLGLLGKLVEADPSDADKLFLRLKDRGALEVILAELGVPASSVNLADSRAVVTLLQSTVSRLTGSIAGSVPGSVDPQVPVGPPQPVAREVKTLKDRIEEAKKDTSYPLQVIEVIEKNKLNAAGHSGSKYSEMIETLLAIPWGKLKKIGVSPEEFQQGLDKSHFGLRKPKELLCDFFTNLIWRYRRFRDEDRSSWRRTGSAFLLVGPPGVGKTSLAISVAQNLRIPYHKLSLGGMRDEADLRGHGFTYEGSKPGAIVQGLVKMDAMNGMFIMDEADKTEKFAVATLLEILDPEQNHLFHDKYTQTTVDIDLSNCHFILTANTLETVPPPVINRCEVITLDRYSIEEKVSIAVQYLIPRVRERHGIGEHQVYFDPRQERELLTLLVKNYTYEAGVRELERIIRTLFLRVFRKEIMTGESVAVRVTRERIKKYLEPPPRPRRINDEDRVGEMLALGINADLGLGSVIPIQATPIRPLREGAEPRKGGSISMVHATGNIQRIMDESRKVAFTAILHRAGELRIDPARADTPIHLHFMAGSTPKDGPSGGGAIALALASVLSGCRIRRDVAMTGEIDTQGRLASIGGLPVKLETAFDAGCKTVIIPRENLFGENGIEGLSDALKAELQILTYDEWILPHEPFDTEHQVLQVVAVEDIVQAAHVACIDDGEFDRLIDGFADHARLVGNALVEEMRNPEPRFTLLYIKDVKELDPDHTHNGFWKTWGCVFLLKPGVRDAVRKRFTTVEEHCRLWDFDPDRDDFADILRNIDASLQGNLRTLVHFSLLAPFYFLMRQRPSLERFYEGSSIEGVTLLANNFAAQGLKIKACKPVLNRVYRYLSRLDHEQLDACPFLAKREGIYVADLSFIPEKYRLDVKRVEDIMNRGLRSWLQIVESTLMA